MLQPNSNYEFRQIYCLSHQGMGVYKNKPMFNRDLKPIFNRCLTDILPISHVTSFSKS